MNNLEEENKDFVQFNVQLKKLGTELCTIRKEINHSQSDMAEWLNVDRRKIIAFESLKKVDLELLLNYANKLSVEVKLNYKVN